MAARAFPLPHGDHQEQGGHGKIHPGGIEAQRGAQQGADGRAQYPVALVQQGHSETKAMFVHPLRGLGRGEEGIGLVGKGKNHIELPGPHAPKLLQHRQSVYQMAEVDHQGEECCLGQGRPCRQQGDAQILAGAGVDQHAHQHSPAHAVADGLEHQAKGHSNGQVAHEHGNGHRKRGGQELSVHNGCTPRTKFFLYSTRFSLPAQPPKRRLLRISKVSLPILIFCLTYL